MKYLIIFVAVWIFIYLLCSFYNLSIDFSKWGKDARFFQVVAGTLISTATTTGVIIIKNTELL